MTNAALNEAMALEVLGWTLESGTSSHRIWHRPRVEAHDCHQHRTAYGGGCAQTMHASRFPWATSVDACLDDILPAIKKLYPMAEWECFESDGEWNAICHRYSDISEYTFVATAPTLARAICLVALDVVLTHKGAKKCCVDFQKQTGGHWGSCPLVDHD